MKSKVAASVAFAIGAVWAVTAVAAEPARVTAKDAEAMVRKGVAYIKATPRDKAMADITDPKGAFVDRELYLTVYDMKGKFAASVFGELAAGCNNN